MKVQCITPFIVTISNRCDFCKEVKPLEYLVTTVSRINYSICSSCRAKTMDNLGLSQHIEESTVWIDKRGAVL